MDTILIPKSAYLNHFVQHLGPAEINQSVGASIGTCIFEYRSAYILLLDFYQWWYPSSLLSNVFKLFIAHTKELVYVTSYIICCVLSSYNYCFLRRRYSVWDGQKSHVYGDAGPEATPMHQTLLSSKSRSR